MKTAIVGSRSFKNYELFKKAINKFQLTTEITEIISGGAIGVDSLAKRFAIENNIKITEFLPDWKSYGKSAGPIRNKQIVENSDYVIAFWDGKSSGTKSSIDFAKSLKKKLLVLIV